MSLPENRSVRLLIRTIGAICAVVFVWLGFVPIASLATVAKAAPAAEQSSAPLAIPVAQGTPVDLSLADLQIQNQILDSSGDAVSVNFGLPASWALNGNSQLNLHFAASMLGWQNTSNLSVLDGRMALRVTLNGQRIAFIPIAGSFDDTITIPIPNGLLRTVAEGNRNNLIFALEARLDCNELSPVELIIYNDTFLQFSYGTRPLQPDLSRYPYPLVQNTIVTDTITLLVPQEPTTNELSAAFAVAASLRQLSSSGDLQLMRESDLSDERRANSHLVLIGQPSRMPLINEVVLAAPAEGDAFPSLPMGPDDGVTQIAGSPWSAAHVVLVVSGANDETVLKAAQSLETLRRWPQSAGTAAMVAEIRDAASPEVQEGRRTFAQMGIYPETIEGAGQRELEFLFVLPFDQTLPGNTVMGLSFAHSALIDPTRSQMSVVLNGKSIAGLRLTEASAIGHVAQVVLPRANLQPGVNRLTLDVDLNELTECGSSGDKGVWLTVRDDSYFEFTPAADGITRAQPFTLDRFPIPFADHPDLAETCIVVPRTDPVAWSAAMRIAMTLANSTYSNVVAPAVAFADDLSDEMRMNHHLILVGQPKDQPLLAELTEQLPVVFKEGSNDPDDQRSRVVMHFNPPESQGYLELVAAPWDARRAVLAVLGRNNTEVTWAASGVTRSSLRNRLSSQLALIQQDSVAIPELIVQPVAPQAQVTPTPEPTVMATATAAPEPTRTPIVTPTQSNNSGRSNRSMLLWAALGGVALLALGGFAFWVSRQQKRGLY